jgi:hypothetical protein
MKYFLDTEFHEYKKKPLIGKPIDTIELISIGIISEDNREYYAICKDFDLKAAWNNEWLRENVLIPIHKDLCSKVGTYGKTYHWKLFEDFTYKSMRNLLNWYGKTRKQIAAEIYNFVNPDLGYNVAGYNNSAFRKSDSYESQHFKAHNVTLDKKSNTYIAQPEFYAYYADYDWVVFCWLFGRMIDLPNGFPMYCRDLKQMLDEKGNPDHKKAVPQTNEHNALADAKWNKELYNFIQTL